MDVSKVENATKNIMDNTQNSILNVTPRNDAYNIDQLSYLELLMLSCKKIELTILNLMTRH